MQPGLRSEILAQKIMIKAMMQECKKIYPTYQLTYMFIIHGYLKKNIALTVDTGAALGDKSAFGAKELSIKPYNMITLSQQ